MSEEQWWYVLINGKPTMCGVHEKLKLFWVSKSAAHSEHICHLSSELTTPSTANMTKSFLHSDTLYSKDRSKSKDSAHWTKTKLFTSHKQETISHGLHWKESRQDVGDRCWEFADLEVHVYKLSQMFVDLDLIVSEVHTCVVFNHPESPK